MPHHRQRKNAAMTNIDQWNYNDHRETTARVQQDTARKPAINVQDLVFETVNTMPSIKPLPTPG